TTCTPSTSRGIRSPRLKRSPGRTPTNSSDSTRALDKCHRHVTGTGLHLDGNIGEAFHYGGPPGSAAAIDRLHVFRAPEVLTERLPAIDQDDHRMTRLDDAR